MVNSNSRWEMSPRSLNRWPGMATTFSESAAVASTTASSQLRSASE